MTIACPDCGTLEDFTFLPRGQRAICRVCRATLELTRGRSIAAALCCSLATLLLLFPANLLPLMSVDLLGMHGKARIFDGVTALWHEHWALLAAMVGSLAVILPFIRFGLLTFVLAAIKLGRRPPWLGRAFRWAQRLDAWAMIDVYLIGGFIGYSRVNAQLGATVQYGGYCLIAAGLLAMVTRASLDARTVWRRISEDDVAPRESETISCLACDLVAPAEMAGERCPRCAARLHARRTDSLIRTSALLIAAFILYFPANVYPMSVSYQLGRTTQYRIIDGVKELFHAGLPFLGVIIFITSITIPIVKIFGLGWCVFSVWRRSTKRLVFRTRLYRLIDEIGRWSNVDPFIIAVFVPLMNFPPLVGANAAPGSTAFILVVILTLLAATTFDARLMWDVAERSER